MQSGITYKWEGIKFRGDAVGGAYAMSREQDIPPWVKHSPLKSSRSGLILNPSGQNSPYYSTDEGLSMGGTSGPSGRARSVSPQRFLEGQGAYQPSRRGEYYFSSNPPPPQPHYYHKSLQQSLSPTQFQQSYGSNQRQGGQSAQQQQYPHPPDPNQRFIVIGGNEGSTYQPSSPQYQSNQFQQQQNPNQNRSKYYSLQQGQSQQSRSISPYQQQEQSFSGYESQSSNPDINQTGYLRIHALPIPQFNYKSGVNIGTLSEYAHPPAEIRAPSKERNFSPLGKVSPDWSTSNIYEVDQYKEAEDIVNQPYRTRPIVKPSIKPNPDKVTGSFLTGGLAQVGVPHSRGQTPQGKFQEYQERYSNELSQMRGSQGNIILGAPGFQGNPPNYPQQQQQNYPQSQQQQQQQQQTQYWSGGRPSPYSQNGSRMIKDNPKIIEKNLQFGKLFDKNNI
ncbi:GATA zinc finger domain-containing protein 10-like isoform X1 [Gordionus sp. m RMFG-2023]|uniref:GATA zinc finger domain-containing protein 10-like isoform X1 n=1 Tax=Gordionus sp. m RMFG-2023 TaxID=3053472 RepID=UPI0031FBC3AB